MYADLVALQAHVAAPPTVVALEEKQQPEEENISKIENLDVNTLIDNKAMKITSLKDINDENLKQATASQISDLIEQELKTASEKFAVEKASVESQLKSTKESLPRNFPLVLSRKRI